MRGRRLVKLSVLWPVEVVWCVCGHRHFEQCDDNPLDNTLDPAFLLLLVLCRWIQWLLWS